MSGKKFGLLVCDIPPPAVVINHGEYPQIISTLLHASAHGNAFALDAYDVVRKMEYPSDEKVEEYDAVIISGSAASAYENLEWINKLVEYVRNLTSTHPRVKIVGICFGHQIVARALGGECIPNDGKWEIAVTSVQLTDIGRAIFGDSVLNIQQMHRDHVPSVPPSLHLVGWTPVAPNQGMVRFSTPEPSPKLTDINILTLQGHPEFTSSIVRAIIDTRASMGVLSPEVADEARSRTNLHDDGPGRIGKTIWGMVGA